MTIRSALHSWLGVTIALAGAAHAQPGLESEKARVHAERQSAEAAFAAQRAACYQKFAVNQCLEDVRARRGDAIADLKRQENLLNDEQRRRDAAEQVRSLEARRAAAVAAESPERRAALEADQRAREQRLRNKGADREATAQRARVREERQVVRTTPAVKDPEAIAAADARAEAGAQQRVREAQARKKKREAENARRSKQAAKPLPVPP